MDGELDSDLDDDLDLDIDIEGDDGDEGDGDGDGGDGEGEGPDPNRVEGALTRDVLAYLAGSIVDDPGSVVIEGEQRGTRLSLRLHVAPDDMGRIIGRRGRTAQAIRTVVRAVGAREGVDAEVDIVD